MILNNLIENYNIFYINNNFNNNPTIWDIESKYINLSFDIKNFREDNAYLWQIRMGDNINSYLNYYNKLKKIDTLGLFNKTIEDGSYGCVTWNINNILISRDLLDSIIEIYYLFFYSLLISFIK